MGGAAINQPVVPSDGVGNLRKGARSYLSIMVKPLLFCSRGYKGVREILYKTELKRSSLFKLFFGINPQ